MTGVGIGVVRGTIASEGDRIAGAGSESPIDAHASLSLTVSVRPALREDLALADVLTPENDSGVTGLPVHELILVRSSRSTVLAPRWLPPGAFNEAT